MATICRSTDLSRVSLDCEVDFIPEIISYKKAAFDRSYNCRLHRLFCLLDTHQCQAVGRSEVIFTLLQFQYLLPDLQIDKFVNTNGLKARVEDSDIDFEGFKSLMEQIVS